MNKIILQDFEGEGGFVKVYVAALIKMPKRISGKIGKRLQKPIIRRTDADEKVVRVVETQSKS